MIISCPETEVLPTGPASAVPGWVASLALRTSESADSNLQTSRAQVVGSCACSVAGNFLLNQDTIEKQTYLRTTFIAKNL